jgi:hypothetical protein
MAKPKPDGFQSLTPYVPLVSPPDEIQRRSDAGAK